MECTCHKVIIRTNTNINNVTFLYEQNIFYECKNNIETNYEYIQHINRTKYGQDQLFVRLQITSFTQSYPHHSIQLSQSISMFVQIVADYL